MFSFEVLRGLCIKHNWFTCGSNRQYDKLFDENRDGASTVDLALIIWICSDEPWTKEQIRTVLVEEMLKQSQCN